MKAFNLESCLKLFVSSNAQIHQLTLQIHVSLCITFLENKSSAPPYLSLAKQFIQNYKPMGSVMGFYNIYFET